jgi:hypothetical protein
MFNNYITERANTVGSPMELLPVSYLRELFEQASGWILKSTAKRMIILSIRESCVLGKKN